MTEPQAWREVARRLAEDECSTLTLLDVLCRLLGRTRLAVRMCKRLYRWYYIDDSMSYIDYRTLMVQERVLAACFLAAIAQVGE